MSYQIVKSKNEYYIYDGADFFGSFHSIADADYNIKYLSDNHRLKLQKSLDSYAFITNVYLR